MFGKVFVRAPLRAGLPLAFRIEDDAPPEASFRGRFFSAGTGKGGNLYSVGRALTRAEQLAASLAKERVVEAAAQGGALSVQSAMARASEALSGAGLQDGGLLAYLVAHDTAGFGPLSMLMEDGENIEEIVVNSPGSRISVYHSRLGFCRTNLSFAGEQQMRSAINRLIADAEKELGRDTPIIDAQLGNGSRVHAQLRPYAPNGAALSIRLNSSNKIDMRKLLGLGALTHEALAYVWMALDCGMNIVISGAPASGKTSLLMSVLSFLPRHERIVLVEEDASELRLGGNFLNSVSLQGRRGSKAELRDQVLNALHVRPDRIIVGELRGPEARDVFAAGNLGIPFMTTMHSNTTGKSLLDRLAAKPMGVERSSVSALDVALFLERSGTERRLCGISEYRWAARDGIPAEGTDGTGCAISELDAASPRASRQRPKVLEAYARLRLVTAQKAELELKRRARFLAKLGGTDGDIADYVRAYGA